MNIAFCHGGSIWSMFHFSGCLRIWCIHNYLDYLNLTLISQIAWIRIVLYRTALALTDLLVSFKSGLGLGTGLGLIQSFWAAFMEQAPGHDLLRITLMWVSLGQSHYPVFLSGQSENLMKMKGHFSQILLDIPKEAETKGKHDMHTRGHTEAHTTHLNMLSHTHTHTSQE